MFALLKKRAPKETDFVESVSFQPTPITPKPSLTLKQHIESEIRDVWRHVNRCDVACIDALCSQSHQSRVQKIFIRPANIAVRANVWFTDFRGDFSHPEERKELERVVNSITFAKAKVHLDSEDFMGCTVLSIELAPNS